MTEPEPRYARRVRCLWFLALATSGCRAILGIETPARGDAGDRDAACASWQPEGFDPCALTIAADALVLGDGAYTYDSATGTLRDPANAVVVASPQTVM